MQDAESEAGRAARPGALRDSEPDDPEPELELEVEELRDLLQEGEELVLLDVREPREFRLCNLGGMLVPLRELPYRLGELDPARPTVVLCHVGIRSARAVAFLRAAGFERVRNLAGGIHAWAERVDPSMPRY